MRFSAEKRYIKIHEVGFYKMIKDRSLRLEEVAVVGYLRGKFLRFNINPFYFADSIIMNELNISRNTLRRVRKLLKLKGILSFKTGQGRNHATEYTMIDSFMASPRSGMQEEIKGAVCDPFKGAVHRPLSNDTISIMKRIKGRAKVI